MTKPAKEGSAWATLTAPPQGRLRIANTAAAHALVDLANTQSQANTHSQGRPGGAQDADQPAWTASSAPSHSPARDNSADEDAGLQEELLRLAALVKHTSAEERGAAQRARAIQEKRQQADDVRHRQQVHNRPYCSAGDCMSSHLL